MGEASLKEEFSSLSALATVKQVTVVESFDCRGGEWALSLRRICLIGTWGNCLDC